MTRKFIKFIKTAVQQRGKGGRAIGNTLSRACEKKSKKGEKGETHKRVPDP